MAIQVLKIARVNAPGAVMCRIGYRRARLFCLVHNHVNFFSASQVVPNSAFGSTGHTQSYFCIEGKVVSRINGQLQPMLHVEKGESAMLELSAHNSARRQAKSIAIKNERFFQIIYTKSDDGDSFHSLAN